MPEQVRVTVWCRRVTGNRERVLNLPGMQQPACLGDNHRLRRRVRQTQPGSGDRVHQFEQALFVMITRNFAQPGADATANTSLNVVVTCPIRRTAGPGRFGSNSRVRSARDS